jgi:hypothetical protein
VAIVAALVSSGMNALGSSELNAMDSSELDAIGSSIIVGWVVSLYKYMGFPAHSPWEAIKIKNTVLIRALKKNII